MKLRYILPITFAFIFMVLELIFLVNSGAGHGWGTGALVLITLPMGIIGIVLDDAFPKSSFVYTLPVLGLIQYVILGYFWGRFVERRRHTKAGA